MFIKSTLSCVQRTTDRDNALVPWWGLSWHGTPLAPAAWGGWHTPGYGHSLHQDPPRSHPPKYKNRRINKAYSGFKSQQNLITNRLFLSNCSMEIAWLYQLQFLSFTYQISSIISQGGMDSCDKRCGCVQDLIKRGRQDRDIHITTN